MRRLMLTVAAITALTLASVAPAAAMSTKSCEAIDRNLDRIEGHGIGSSQAAIKLAELFAKYCGTTPG